MAKYGKKAQSSVKKAMQKYKRGKLKSGKSEKTVESREQAIAIGLSEARKEGARVPKKKAYAKTTKAKSAKKKTTAKKTTVKRKATAKKSAARKASKS